MNLDQLALQCYEECGDYHLGSVSQFNHKKFAELIIKECARVQHERFCKEGDVSWDLLMQHFGVE